MGCTPSKPSVCRNCHAECSPARRSYSCQAYLSPSRDGDNGTHHVVALTSTTLGYLLLDQSTKSNHVSKDPAVARILQESVRRNAPEKNSKDLAVGMIEAKTWSKMIDENITKIVPKTPIRTPPGEPETINAWELMEGLDDTSPLQPPSMADCFSFNVNPNSSQLEKEHQPTDHTGDDAKKSSQNRKTEETLSRGKEKLILYFTSLRGVRKTYEDCCHVRVILKNSGVKVDERDVSMHSGFKEELKELLGEGYGGGGLPKVFVGKKYIGGADEIRRFHEEFQLDKVLEGCEMVDDKGGAGGGGDGCEACGDTRFLLCETCSGSCKIYNEVSSDDEDVEESDYGFQRCPDCNENGLIRCTICCL